jgi:hypothetical protein
MTSYFAKMNRWEKKEVDVEVTRIFRVVLG